MFNIYLSIIVVILLFIKLLQVKLLYNFGLFDRQKRICMLQCVFSIWLQFEKCNTSYDVLAISPLVSVFSKGLGMAENSLKPSKNFKLYCIKH